jgi:hypothetical protein
MLSDIQSWFKRVSAMEWLSIVAGTITALTVLATLLVNWSSQTNGPTLVNQYDVERYVRVQEKISVLEKDVASLRNQLQALSNVPDENKIAIQLKGMDTALTDLKARHAKLEDAILTNPAKAIEVPLLRKDLDNLKDSQQQNLLALQQGVDRIYDLNKWLLGAMAVSIITLAISNVLSGRKKKPADGI